jgi:hypothetical protein
MDNIELEVHLKRYRENKHDYLAELDGEEIFVDPYVGCVWDDDYQFLGKVKFEGFWGSDGSFLPGKQLSD